MATTCNCDCHTGPYAACNITGGCGTTGCTRDTAGTCPACRRRDPEHGLVCEPCRTWLPTALHSIGEKYSRLPDVLVPTTSPDGAKVSGSKDPSAPLNLDAEDLLTRVVRLGGIPVDSTPDTLIPADELHPVHVNVTSFEVNEWIEETADGHTIHREGQHIRKRETRWQRRIITDINGQPILHPAGDQIGYLPVAQILDVWARDWATARSMREQRPTPTVPNLINWLGHRLGWACDHYEPIGDFAADIREVRGNLMRVLGEFDPPPRPCEGVECARCDRRQLFHADDGSGDIVCRNENCRKVYRADEYHDLVKALADRERHHRTPGDIQVLLRRREPAGLF